MKQYLLKTIALGSLAALLGSSAFSQDVVPDKPEKPKKNEQIIIRNKGDKDVKITVEIKDGKTLINGKPADEFKDDNVSIQNIETDGDIILDAPLPPIAAISPFRGNWSYSSDDDILHEGKTAFLGVTSEEADGGGVKVLSISDESGAQKAGLVKGDIITKINDDAVNTPDQLSRTIHKYKPEDKVTVTYKRDGKEQKVTATLGKFKGVTFKTFRTDNMNNMKIMRDDMAPRAYSFSYNVKPRLGVKAQDTEDGKGVKVIDIDDDSPADKAGIKEGDIITDFDGKPVNSADDLVSASRAAKDKASFKVKLKRNDKVQEVEVKIPKKLKTADL
ncbi:MAG: PDZ domain-containing protein [Bacteroidetes bacterium]|nr:PDZ domain-containing protein [Bacteroidota bacterium]MBS1933184.1 PDZ domain-containing protein [Bacteroidota bacterium]